jgi:hypothetical protein
VGRTQPSQSKVIEEELRKLLRVAEKLRDKRLREKIEKAIPNIRRIQEAMYDEVSDPLEVIYLALLLS